MVSKTQIKESSAYFRDVSFLHARLSLVNTPNIRQQRLSASLRNKEALQRTN